MTKIFLISLNIVFCFISHSQSFEKGGVLNCVPRANKMLELASVDMTWIECADYCKNLDTLNISDWRMPTRMEYLEIRLEQNPSLTWSNSLIWTSDFAELGTYYTIEEPSLVSAADPFNVPLGCRCVSRE